MPNSKLYKVDQFLKGHKLPKFIQGERDNLNKSITI